MQYAYKRARQARLSSYMAIELDEYQDVAVDGLLKALRTFDATRGTSWRLWRNACIFHALLEFRCKIAERWARNARRDELLAREQAALQRRYLMQWSDEVHDLSRFAAYVNARGFSVIMPRLEALMRNARKCEVAAADGVTGGAVSSNLKDARRLYREWQAA